ncbi:putative pentatricopeptide repeat-containing protein [Iris pallida]|uniref:Pentatricopeptide repeat-containing protein n=1 Tax=Iris pallida TaxID=29817 RepID=A0AAX6HSJ3_IRIPA|nr:putative pentatricopeptide repeat-containing protein [Iris pallida]
MGGPRPSLHSIPLLVAAAKSSPNPLHRGEELHCLSVKLGLLSHLHVPNSLIHLYASADALDSARQLFDEMPHRDAVSYNSLLDGYVRSADFPLAEDLLRRSPYRNVVSFSTLFNGYVRSRMFEKGMGLFRAMQRENLEPGGCSIVSLLLVYSHLRLGLYGKSVHGYLVRKWAKIPDHIRSALVDFYGKCGLLDSAARVFEATREKDLVCYSAMIAGLGRRGRGWDALEVFRRMRDQGVTPNYITFVNVLSACSHSGMIEQALRYFEMMSSEFGIKPTFAHYWCLVDLFVRIQSPHDALKVIQCMPLDSESAIWGALIWLARVRGDISVGEYLGRRLIELEPDNSRRYVPLANIYAAAPRWDKYEELQNDMKARGLKKLPDCTLIDMNVVVHKFSVGDGSQPEIEEMYKVLGEVGELLKLRPVEAAENDLAASL